jgi:hypothetical protein
MMTGMGGRIAAGKRIHRIVRYAVPSKRGVTRCGWAGEVTLIVDGVVSCTACVREGRTADAREPAAAEAHGTPGLAPPNAGRP